MSVARHHAEWLSLVDISGPFLSLPVLLRVFPQQLDTLDTDISRVTRLAFSEWEDAEGDRAVHHAWLQFVLGRVLRLPDEVLAAEQAIPPGLEVELPEHGENLRPQWAVKRPEDERPSLLVVSYPADQPLDRPATDARWRTASPATRMMTLLQGTGVPLGLVTNGVDWMLVATRPGEATTYVTWDAALWSEEPLTLRAFCSLLGTRRLFGVAEADRLPALLAESAQNQQEVTDQLGFQVRKAVEVLVQAVDRINIDCEGRLLSGVGEKQLYQAALTVMMRLVFVLSAEERGLLLLGDPLWNRHYAISTLRDQLREVPDENLLTYRHDAWSRLLATFRAIYAGVEHDQMRLPAYGGALFDPDRFAFLEGRPAGTRWQNVPAQPLPISNRTVLHLLEALQFLQMRLPGGGGSEPRRLSFRALDIEQIGHVYEGLLDHTARRAASTVVGLRGSAGEDVEIELSTLEAKAAEGDSVLVDYLKERTGRTAAALRRDMTRGEPPSPLTLQAVCAGHEGLYTRIAPFAHLLREDSSGQPVVIHTGSIYVTKGSDRRSTGTHYTPRALTEDVVKTTLDPLLYTGVCEGTEPSLATLKQPTDILALKVCDPACGSGAFLVQACRYMAERVVEGWARAEAASGDVGPLTVPEAIPAGASHSQQILPVEPEERLALARRLVAERCLYGVDFNPMAVEMAKLSLWLVTLHKHRPFTFLDHAIKCGDSLLGLHDPGQLERFHLVPSRAQAGVLDYLLREVQQLMSQARAKREELERFTALDVRDAELKAELHQEAEDSLSSVRLLADLIVGSALSTAGPVAGRSNLLLDARLQEILVSAASVLGPNELEPREKSKLWDLRKTADRMLGTTSIESSTRRPFHWFVEFPEAFPLTDGRGFDAVVGNPPFLGGTLISTSFGHSYSYFLQLAFMPWHGKADLVAAFFRMATQITNKRSVIGFVATSSLLRGETCDVSLIHLSQCGWPIFSATSPKPWPGSAATEYVKVFLSPNTKIRKFLDGKEVEYISPRLEVGSGLVSDELFELAENEKYGGALGVKLSPNNGEALESTLNEKFASFPQFLAYKKVVVGGEELYGYLGNGAKKWALDLPQEVVVNNKCALNFRHSAPASGIRAKVESNRLAFACGETSVNLAFDLLPKGVLPKHKLVVFVSRSFALLAILSSSFHSVWAWSHGLRRKADLVYSPKRCFATFPMPKSRGAMNTLSLLARRLLRARRAWMATHKLGLTRLYNEINSPQTTDASAIEIRTIHKDIDVQLLTAYDWADIELEHDFYELEISGVLRTRFTISQKARKEILRRLAALNHQRYQEEQNVVQCIDAAKEMLSGPRKRAGRPASKKVTAPSSQPQLFE